MKLRAARQPRPYEQTARAKATEQTGRRIVDVFFDRLMDSWYDEITLDAVAADAGVTVQTIVRRFGGKEGLLNQAARRFAEQVHAKRATPTGDLDAMVASLFADYEVTGDAVLRLLALETRLPAIKEVTNFGRGEHRAWVATALAQPLAALPPGRRQRALDAAVIATDVYTWKLLRRDMQRDVTESRQTVKSLIQSALTQATH
jgi:AcrR family transcriptional regulator